MKKALSSILVSYMALALVFLPALASAQSSSFNINSGSNPCPPAGTLTLQMPCTTGSNSLLLPSVSPTSQSASFLSGQTTGSANPGDLTSTIESGTQCSAGTILSNLITSQIGSSIGKLAGKNVSQVTDNALYVPVTQNGYLANQQLLETYRTVGAGDPTGNTLISASFNAIAWCIVNTMIQYIVNSTIQWAKTGFNGNPAFIDNPDQFFKGIADQTAGTFIQSLVSGQTGINICAPFRNLIGISLAQNYSYSYGQRASCTITDIGNNFSQADYLSDWLNTSQNQANYPSGSYLENSNALSQLLASRQNSAQTSLNWNNGYLSFQSCSDPKDPRTCKVSTPGSLIQSSLEQNLNIPKGRLQIAQSFDQLVGTLVNSLISVALNKVLSGTQGIQGH